MPKLLLTLLWLAFSGSLFAQGPACTSFPLPTDPPLTPTPGLMNYLKLKGIVPNPCTGTPNLPDPSLGNLGCFASVERYISRPVMVDDLVQGLNFQPCSCDPSGLNGVPLHNTAEPPLPCPATTPCPPNNTTEFGSFLPYFEDIGLLVDLQATQAMLAGKQYGGGNDWNLTAGFYANIRQVVVDINAAFDCAHLRRPSIQGQITEAFSKITQDIKICPEVIEAFKKAGDTQLAYYLDANGNPRTDRSFSTCNIVNVANIPDCANTLDNHLNELVPDISRIECRLWFFHVAKAYIDAGYTSCAMGQISLWGANDRTDDGEYDDTFLTLEVIRNYAAENNTFFLMVGEPHLAGQPADVPDRRPGHEGERMFLWDYDGRPLRPREVTDPPHVDPELGAPQCGDYANSPDLALFQEGGTCSKGGDAALAAVIDLCHLEHFAHHVTGNTPYTGCDQVELPFQVYFDYGPGEFYPVNAYPGWNGTGQPGAATYGYSDSNWFAELSSECQAAWVQAVACRIRDLSNGLGFFAIPGRVRTPQRNTDGTGVEEFHNSYASFQEQFYRIMENPSAVTAVKSAWKVNKTLSVTRTAECFEYACKPYCSFSDVKSEEVDARTPDKFKIVRGLKYHFCVDTPDCTSTYTWHLRRGTEALGYHRSLCFDFIPREPGTYVIGLSQDNLALDYNSQGTTIIPADITINVEIPAPTCPCMPVDLCTALFLSADCYSSTTEKSTYDFTIPMPAKVDPAYVVLSARQGEIEEYSFSSLTKAVTGKLIISNNDAVPVMDVVVRYKSSDTEGLFNEFNVFQELPPCSITLRPITSTTTTSTRLMPVPADDVLKVISESKSEGTRQNYKIINSAGNIVQEGHLTESVAQLKVDNLPNGIYFLQIVSPFTGEHEYLRFIITR